MKKNISAPALFLMLFSCNCMGQWVSDSSLNTPVCTAYGSQIDLRMTEDGKGGAFIAWKDYRNWMPDIYIQHLDSGGNALWAQDGVGLCTDPNDQSTPAITGDMHGGAIVAWSDWRSGIERDIYAQRIDSAGNILWAADGIIVAGKAQREHNEKIISDDAGGAIIVWEQQDYYGYWDIWAQRINPSGNVLWASGGIPVCIVPANRLNPKVQKDGKGGAFVTWQDYRTNNDYDVYIQRISASGILQWISGGIPVSAATGPQVNPKIDPDSISGGAYICWVDGRSGNDYDIYAQRIDSAGNMLWALNGVAVCTAPGNQSAPDLLSDDFTNGPVITWKDLRSGDFDIYVQRLDPAGNAQWTGNGVPLCTSAFPQLNPNIANDGTGGAVITWQDSANGNWDVRSQRIDASGSVLWPANGKFVSAAPFSQTSPKNIYDGREGCIYAWQDKRSGTFDIYAHRLSWAVDNTGVKEKIFPNNTGCYPNPFTDKLTIELPDTNDQGVCIGIINLMGDEVLEKRVYATGKYTINTTSIPAGPYFVRITGNTGTRLAGVVKSGM